jgi:phage terminase large subunit
MNEAAKKLKQWREDPIVFVNDNFGERPDDWQAEFMLSVRDNPRTCASACKGPGKSCVEAWVAWWFLSLHPQAKGFALSITGDNLRDNLWAEIALWQKKSKYLSEQFMWQSERIFAKESPQSWFISTRQWSKQADKSSQANTLAGLHGKYTIVLVDEAGDIPSGVMEAADASLSTGIRNRICMTGNPTRTEGPLYDAVKTFSHMWKVIKITGDPENPKRAARISKQWAQEQIDKWGRDNPWVMINVLGEFPPAGSTKLIGPEEIDAAFAANPAEPTWSRSPRIIGVDPARFSDDKAVMFPRQGLMSWRPRQYRNLDTEQLGDELVRYMDKWDADAAFVDSSGYGIALVDWCHTRGFEKVHAINFGQKAADAERFVNKRAEMYWDAAKFLRLNKGRAALPRIPELKQELCAPNYDYDPRGRVILDPKDDIKDILQRSPDLADGYVLTFASPVRPRQKESDVLLFKGGKTGRVATEYDLFKD